MKNKLLFLGALLPIAVIPALSLSMNIDNEKKPNKEENILSEKNEIQPKQLNRNEDNYNELNLDGFISSEIVKYDISNEDFERIASNAQNNEEVLNWMNNVFTNNLDFHSATQLLFSSNLDKEIKEFMFNGLYDKMSARQTKIISNIKFARAKSSTRSSYYVSTQGTKILNRDGSYVINQGRSRVIPEIHDSLWNDDVSYIRYDTQDVYNVYTKGLDKDFVKKLQKSLYNIKRSKAILDSIIRNVDFFIPEFLSWNPIYNPDDLSSSFKKIYKAMTQFSPDIKFLTENIDWLTKTGMYTNDIKEILEDYNLITNYTYSTIDWKKISISVINKFIKFLLNLKVPSFITAIIDIKIHFIIEFLHLPIGNGYSALENMHDHGLNDWNSQLRNNFSAIGSLAQQASERGYELFHDGVEWKVTDGWWTLPKLHLRWQGSSRWIDVSPGQSFNWGNRIPPRY